MAETVNQSNEGTVARVSVLEERVTSLKNIIDERDLRYTERFKATDEKTGLALTASEKAVTKAENATEKRFDSVNEFRGSLKDQASTLLPRAEAEAKFKAYDDKVEDLKKDIASLRETRSATSGKERKQVEDMGLFQWAIGLLILIGGVIVGHFWK